MPGIATKRGAAPGQAGRGPGAKRAHHMHSARATDNYEMRVAAAAGEAGLAAGTGPVEVRLVVWLPDRRSRDDDRIKCAINDGLKRAGKRALADDNMLVIQRSVVELGGIDRNNPRVEVTITMLEEDRAR